MAGRKGKVCVLTTSHIAKDVRVFYRESVSLARAGYEVVVAGQNPAAETVEGVRIIPFSPRRSQFQRYVRNNLRCLWVGLRTRADVYHFHDPEMIPVAMLLRLLGKRVIYDVHEDYREKLLGRRLPELLKRPAAALWWLWEKNAARCCNHVLAADSHIRERFGGKRCTVLGNYPPVALTQIERRPSSDGVFRIMYAGRMNAHRGMPQLLDALDRLTVPAVELHAAGRVHDAALVERLRSHPRVVFHGLLPWEEVNAYLAGGDLGTLLLQPVAGYSNLSGEGILKLFEYMAVGLPVLVSNFPRLKALVESLGAGIGVDPTSPEEIAKAIDYLYQNPKARQRMGENGRRAVRERFNWECEEQKLLALYARLVP